MVKRHHKNVYFCQSECCGNLRNDAGVDGNLV